MPTIYFIFFCISIIICIGIYFIIYVIFIGIVLAFWTFVLVGGLLQWGGNPVRVC